MKKLLMSGVVVVMAIGVYFAMGSPLNQKNELITKNIEALSAVEQASCNFWGIDFNVSTNILLCYGWRIRCCVPL